MVLKYNNTSQSKELISSLKVRISEHLDKTEGGPYANTAMWIKIWLILGLWACTYALIISNLLQGPWLIAMAVVHAVFHLLIAFNISHDANHGALSKSPVVNRLYSYTLDLIGVSSYFWRIAHNQQHHSFINVFKIDDNINGYGIMRFTPADEKKPIHKYQHWYATLLYGLVTLNYVTIKDFRLLIKSMWYKHPITLGAIAELFFFKILYYTYVFVVPMYVLDVSFWQIVPVFLLGHFIVGVLLSYIFQCGHLTEEAHYPEIEEDHIQDAWATHVIKSTCDYAARNSALTYLSGAINIHIAHHLFPHICHIHYRSLIPFIKAAAQAHDLTYRDHPTISIAIRSHLNMLKDLGRE